MVYGLWSQVCEQVCLQATSTLLHTARVQRACRAVAAGEWLAELERCITGVHSCRLVLLPGALAGNVRINSCCCCCTELGSAAMGGLLLVLRAGVGL
jgi:hypothetical protein